MAKRLHPRVVLEQRVDYRHSLGQGSGTLMNLSSQGCHIHAAFPFPSGARLRLNLSLPGEDQSVDIERGAVRWIKNQEFGVAFLELTPEARTRIEQVMTRLQKTQQPAVQLQQQQTIPASAFTEWDFGSNALADEPEIRVAR